MPSPLDHPVLSQRLFFPRPGRLPETHWVQGAAGRLACSLHAPHPGAMTVVHFHGNGETVEDYLGPTAQAFTGLGVNVLFAEYRGYGASDGVPALAAMLDDVPAVVEAAGVGPEHLVFFGRSLGSIYAIEAAARYPGAAGLAIESGIADVLERVQLRVRPDEIGATGAEIVQEVARCFDHRAKLGSFTGQVLVLHTRHDGLLDPAHAERIHEWAAGPKRLRIFERGDHNSIMYFNAGDYWDELRLFVAAVS